MFIHSGTIVFLWHSLFEGALTGILDVLRRVSDIRVASTVHLGWSHVLYRITLSPAKGSQQDSGAPELVAMCRNMFCYLHQLSELGQEGGQGVQDSQVQDMVAIPTYIPFSLPLFPPFPFFHVSSSLSPSLHLIHVLQPSYFPPLLFPGLQTNTL